MSDDLKEDKKKKKSMCTYVFVGFSFVGGTPQVACGFAYTAAVTASGELYTWGAGENGRLGLGDVADRHTPSR